MTQNAGKGRHSKSPLKETILEVFRRRKTRKLNPLETSAISARKEAFSDDASDEDTMPSHLNGEHRQKTIIERRRRKKRTSKPRRREGTKVRQRETSVVAEVMRKAEQMTKFQHKASGDVDKDDGSFAIIAKTRLTQQVGFIDKARKSQMIHRLNNGQLKRIVACSKPSTDTSPHKSTSQTSHLNGTVSVAGGSDEGQSPAKPSGGVGNGRQFDLSNVASRLLSSLPVVKKEGLGYLDQLKSDLKGMCEHSEMTISPKPVCKTSPSPSHQLPEDSRSKRTRPGNNCQEHSRHDAVAVTLDDDVKPMEIDGHDDVIPEERGKSELARLFGGFELNAPGKDRTSLQPENEDKQHLSTSQCGSIPPSQLPVARHESFPCASNTTDDGLHDIMPSGHVTDLLDLLDDPQMWGTTRASGCDGLDYGMRAVSPGWTLRKFKPLSLSADSPSPVKLYPRRLY